VRNNHNYQEED